MARGINKAILIGNLGNSPDVKATSTGNAVTNVSLATSESWKDKNTGEQQERTEWHRIVFFGRLAEIAGEYLHKGSKVYIEGRIQTRKWQDKDGNDRYSTEIVANEMQMLDSKGSHDGKAVTSDYADLESRHSSAQSSPATTTSSSTSPTSKVEDFDDIPF